MNFLRAPYFFAVTILAALPIAACTHTPPPAAPATSPLVSAETRLASAVRLRKKHPARALSLYLDAASATQPGAISGDPDSRALHNTAVAEAAVLAFSLPVAGGTIRVIRPQLGEGPADEIESIVTAQSVRETKGQEAIRKPNIRDGIGGTLVAHQLPTLEQLALNPYLPLIGRYVPLTATIEFTKTGDADSATIRLHDVREFDRTTLDGRSVLLAANFTAPLYKIIAAMPEKNIGFKAMCHPQDYLKDTGILMPEPFQPGKIPVIMVHGIKMDPTTWRNAYNELIADPAIRDNYQFWFFRYPSGLPLLYSASLLKKHMDSVHRWARENGGGSELDQTVLIGHSMGGVISNIQIREGGDALRKRLLTKDVDNLGLNATDREALEDLLLIEPAPFVTRAILISAPHRGSHASTGIVGTIGKLLINLPKNVTTLNFLKIARPLHEGNFTAFGRNIILGPTDGIRSLSPDDPILEEIARLPVGDHITFHTIIANKAKGEQPTRGSTDGLVEYESAHLRGAASEKIIDSGHRSHESPEGIAEIRRILLLHLSKQGCS